VSIVELHFRPLTRRNIHVTLCYHLSIKDRGGNQEVEIELGDLYLSVSIMKCKIPLETMERYFRIRTSESQRNVGSR
jgi:hypothetical protein